MIKYVIKSYVNLFSLDFLLNYKIMIFFSRLSRDNVLALVVYCETWCGSLREEVRCKFGSGEWT